MIIYRSIYVRYHARNPLDSISKVFITDFINQYNTDIVSLITRLPRRISRARERTNFLSLTSPSLYFNIITRRVSSRVSFWRKFFSAAHTNHVSTPVDVTSCRIMDPYNESYSLARNTLSLSLSHTARRAFNDFIIRDIIE